MKRDLFTRGSAPVLILRILTDKLFIHKAMQNSVEAEFFFAG